MNNNKLNGLLEHVAPYEFFVLILNKYTRTVDNIKKIVGRF